MTERTLPGSAPGVSLIAEEDLVRFYIAVSRAQSIGFFRGHHGPLEETAWVHVALHELEEIEDVARRVISGDVGALHRLRTIVTAAPHWPHAVQSAQTASAKPIVRPRQPLAVATAGALLDRVWREPAQAWAQRAMGYYALRALAVNRALVGADQALALKVTSTQFVATVHAANPFGGVTAEHMSPSGPTYDASGPTVGSHAGHAAHASYPPNLPTAAMAAPEPHSADSESDLLVTELTRYFTTVSDAAGDHRALPTPSMLLHLADKIATFPDDVRSAEQPLRDLARKWSEIDYLLPITTPGQPQNAPEREGVRDRCVEGQPQTGGRWEIARVRATEIDEMCPPAQSLDRASGKAYGFAGSHLIEAQNEWINAKQCFDDPGTKKCRREEDRGYNKCTEERDDGYNQCDRKEDQGHNECCDWWPCSWACDALVWIAHLVCVVWTWISNIVCVVWTWIKKIVCVAWSYVKAVGCAIGHLAATAFHVALGLGGILAGAALRTGGGILGKLCDLVGAKPETRITDGLKVVGIHVAMLHTGKVLIFAYDEGVQPVTSDDPADFTAIGDSDRALCALWDPQSGDARYVPLHRNLFCAHHAFTEDGRLLVAGGQFPLPGLLKSLIPPKLLAPGADCDVHLFDPVREQWDRLPDMQNGRWYPTCALLPDGRVFVISGTNGYATEPGLDRGIQNTWQFIDPRSGTVDSARALPFHNIFHLYPFMHVLPTGELFIHFKRTTMLFKPDPDASFRRIAAGGADSHSLGRTQHPFSRTGPGPGTSALLPLNPRRDSQTGRAVYPKGRVLILGGGGAEKEGEPKVDGEQYELNSYTDATSSAEILDLDTSDPQWKFTKEPMHRGRVMPDVILLPTGKALVVGGGGKGQSGGLLAHFTSSDVGGKPNKGATDPVRAPQLFDPETETWELLCPKPLERLYHTTAILLPDARVLVAGHDGALNMPPFDTSRYEGQSAARPIIAGAPETVTYGQTFSLETPVAEDVQSIALIRQSSLTHQINSDQRFVGLLIETAAPGSLTVQAPPNGNVAPPGQYMLFVVNRAGVPSVARWIRVAAG